MICFIIIILITIVNESDAFLKLTSYYIFKLVLRSFIFYYKLNLIDDEV